MIGGMSAPTGPLDLEHLSRWVGSRETATDRFDARRAQQLAASLDLPPEPLVDGADLPPLWHWIYGTPVFRLSESGPDGHLRRGEFLPPVPLPRRMWAGGRFEWRRLPRLGEAFRRESTVEGVTPKQGRAGTLVFVRVRHEVHAGADLALTEWHDIVYRDLGGGGGAAAAAPRDETARRAIVPTGVLLFRYSALTFNSHRIHYDRRYCVEEEGYPGLVVHGPLMATLMAQVAWDERGHACPAGFRFRALAPVFDGTEIEACARRTPAESVTWIRARGGALAMEGAMTW